jgi:HAD superfamily hydrolase (TIGR01549 family)
MNMVMTIQAVLFDLDGTLLDYDMRNDFLPHYFQELGKYFAPIITPEKLIKGIMLGSDAIGDNDGSVTNEEAFARVFYPSVNMEREKLEPEFLKFYKEVFPTLQQYSTQKPEAYEVIATAFNLGYRVVIATNPYFPAIAVQERLVWAGIHGFPYAKVTNYENSHFAKPDPRYFLEIVDELDCQPAETLVVGDEAMDMVAGLIECQTFLVNSAATIENEIHPPPTYQGTLNDVKTLLTNNRHIDKGGA